MASKRPTVILVHGAWHTPECWDLVRPLLEKDFKVVTPALAYASTRDKEPITSMGPVIADLQSVIASETSQGNDVVLVNHSFGGTAGNSAVKGFSRKDPSRLRSAKDGRVIGLVNVPAFLAIEGQSMVDFIISPANPSQPAPTGKSDYNITSTGWSEIAVDPHDLFYNDMSREDSRRWIDRLIGQSAMAFTSREGSYSGWKDVPTWYLVCTLDAAMPEAQQWALVKIIEEGGGRITARTLEAAHSPFLSKPKDFVEFVEDAVRDFTAA